MKKGILSMDAGCRWTLGMSPRYSAGWSIYRTGMAKRLASDILPGNYLKVTI